MNNREFQIKRAMLIKKMDISSSQEEKDCLIEESQELEEEVVWLDEDNETE